jgi:poly-beta-1,6-N-acetyl-D-glucosamine biosynthesis protein PgaD
MSTQAKPWPPIIRNARMPRLIVWRDLLITAAMWFLLLWLCRHALVAAADTLRYLLGSGHPPPSLHLAERWTRLAPYFAIVGLFAMWLLVSMTAALRRRRLNALLPQPAPLALEDEARRAGCTAAELTEWRTLKICTAHLDGNGALAVERVSTVEAEHP